MASIHTSTNGSTASSPAPKISAEPARGYKECFSCNSFSPARARRCGNCGHAFRLRGKNSARSKAKAAQVAQSNVGVVHKSTMAGSAKAVKPLNTDQAKNALTGSTGQATSRASKVKNAPSKGFKQCPACNRYAGVRSFSCPSCGYSFYGHKSQAVQPATPEKTVETPSLNRAIERATEESDRALNAESEEQVHMGQEAVKAGLRSMGFKLKEITPVLEEMSGPWSRLDERMKEALTLLGPGKKGMKAPELPAQEAASKTAPAAQEDLTQATILSALLEPTGEAGQVRLQIVLQLAPSNF